MTSLLALTNSFSWAKLKVKQDQQTLEMLKGIFPGARFYVLKDDIYIVYDDSKYKIGYAFLAKGKGFGGDILIFTGLKDEETIKSITIISHNEHEGALGEESGPIIDFNSFVYQFIGLKIIDCDLKKYGGQVDGISGATISSEAVVDIVRETALEKVKSIRSWVGIE
jgi:electron transport complex protein RnfG